MSKHKQAAIANALDSLRHDKSVVDRKAAFLRQFRTEINRLMVPMYAAFEACCLRWEPSIDVCQSYPGMQARIHVTTKDLDTFKDARLVAMLETFTHAHEATSKEYPTSINRDYHFTFQLDGNCNSMHVTVAAYVRPDSDICRKVVKSVKTREVEDIEYELVCD